MATSDEIPRLDPRYRRIHRALIAGLLRTGDAPTASALADHLGTPPEAVREGLLALAAADYLALDAGGRVACLYPLSVAPTPHVVVVDGRPRFAMCAIDALGIPAMLGQELDIAGGCAVCNAPVALRVGPGTIVSATPRGAMVAARRDEVEPAFAACCPFTVFVCGHEHADRFLRRIAGARALSLPDALGHAEEIFGALLAENIPATRPRGKRWEPPRDA